MTNDEFVNVGFSLHDRHLDRLEDIQTLLNERMPHREVSRSEAARWVILAGVTATEQYLEELDRPLRPDKIRRMTMFAVAESLDEGD